jgi:predicted phosphoribosyltransferase
MQQHRRDAALSLAEVLVGRRYPNPLVLGVPRGGVPIAAEIARVLDCPVDLWLARDIPVPFHRERVLGGVSEHGLAVLDPDEHGPLDETIVRETVRREQDMLLLDRVRFRNGAPSPDVRGCTAILVDEAIESPWRVIAAARDLVKRGARRVVIATPIIMPSATVALRFEATEIACVTMALDRAEIRAWCNALPPVPDLEIARETEYASFSIAS